MNKKKIWIIAALLLVVIALIVTIWINFFQNFGKVYQDDIIIVSPDQKNQLLIREWGTIGGTGAEIYIINPDLPKFLTRLLMVKVGTTSADDCCLPFSEGNYDVVWEDDLAVIHYFKGRTQNLQDKATWSTLRCDLK